MKQFTQEQFAELLLNQPEKFPNNQSELTRRLPTGEIIGVRQLASTHDLCIGIDEQATVTYRFCYPKFSDAVAAFMAVTDPYTVPTGGWVTAYPENRMMLPKHIWDMAINEKQAQIFPALIFKNYSIEVYIANAVYTAKHLRSWLQKNNPNPDKGVVSFLNRLEMVEHLECY